MDYIGKFFKNNKWNLIGMFFITVIYFAVRLPNLTYQPIFADEAIYIRWAQVMKAEPTLRFLPLSDGKTPLFMWAMMPLFKVFEDPLFAGRILSVFSGFGSLLGLTFIGTYFVNKRVGLWTAFLVAITPYFVFFDRMALVDSMLAAFSIWSVAVALLLIRFPRIDLAMLLGYLMGGALLTKTPAFFTVVTMPLSVLVFNFKKIGREKRIIQLFMLWIVAIVICVGIYNILRLGPGFSNLNSRNQDYVLSPTMLLVRPLDPFIPHFNDLKEWFPPLLGWGVLIGLAWGVLQTFRSKHIYLAALLLFSLIPLGIEMALLKTFTARYILFPVTYLIVIASFGIDNLVTRLSKIFSAKTVVSVVVLLLVVWPAYYIFLLHTNLEKAPLPRAERNGYLEEWTAGYGLKEIADYLIEESKKEDIVVTTEGSFGTLPDGLQIYVDKVSAIAVVGGGSSISASYVQTAKEHPTYFVANRSGEDKFGKHLELVKEFPKIRSVTGKQESTVLFKVNYWEEPAY